jgi:iron-regulated transporter 1
MRRIDLMCKLMGPLFIALIDGISTRLAILVNLGMNVFSVILEYFSIAKVSPGDKLPHVQRDLMSNLGVLRGARITAA